MTQKCCVIGCNEPATFEINARRPDGSPAGPDPYSDDTFACEHHVGYLLGWQPNAKNTDEIEWLVTQCNTIETSKHSTDSITDEK